MQDQDLDFVRAPNLAVPHGFSTRAGGVSKKPFDSLNLGLSTGNEANDVAENRRRFLAAFDTNKAKVCALKQVHGVRVVEAAASWFELEADAAVTDNPELLLLVSAADCFPLLFHDPLKKLVAVAHGGWRGTVQGIAGKVVRRLVERYGSSPADIRVAIGPGIGGGCYQVGDEVIRQFEQAGFPAAVWRPDDEGRHRLDLVLAHRHVLSAVGVQPQHIWDSDLCTHCDDERFYSHRRDQGKTGRHWAAIRLV